VSQERPISRRQLLRGGFLGGVADALADAVPLARGQGGGPADAAVPGRGSTAGPGAGTGGRRGMIPVHRPPGAVDERAFLRDCTRCDACIEACPHDAIVHAPPRLRQASGTPMIDPARQPCWMCQDFPCIAACEPGVLRPDQPLRMGRAMIVEQTCLAHQGTFCTVCSERCPVPGAIVLSGGKPRVVEERCTGCGVCFHVCPAPQNAVIAMPLPDRPVPVTPPGGRHG
jgi:ferredoxin-type protein NapG